MAKRQGKNKKALRKRQKQAAEESFDGKKIPRSMILHRGSAHPTVKQLVRDLRQVMSPNTATKLTSQRKNQLKDFLHVAPVIGVSHLVLMNQKSTGLTLRIARVPRGPTLTFNVLGYSLVRDVAARQKRPHSPGSEYHAGPLVVLNSFSSASDHVQIMSSMFQNMFEPIDLKTLKLNEVRRVVLLHRDSKAPADSGVVQLRHFLIKAVPVGVSRRINKLLKRKKVPNLGQLKDISQFVEDPHLDGVMSSDSEGEDGEDSRVTLAQSYLGRGNEANQQSAIRLKEIGPRVTLQLLKIEEEMNGGKVLYHRLISRTEQEAEALVKSKRDAIALKRQRKAEQLRNVNEKRKAAGLPPLEPEPDSDAEPDDGTFWRPDEDQSEQEEASGDDDEYYFDGDDDDDDDDDDGGQEEKDDDGSDEEEEEGEEEAGSSSSKSDSIPSWIADLVQKASAADSGVAAEAGDDDSDSPAEDDEDQPSQEEREPQQRSQSQKQQKPKRSAPADKAQENGSRPGAVVDFLDERKLRRKKNNKLNRKRKISDAGETAAPKQAAGAGANANKRQKRAPPKHK